MPTANGGVNASMFLNHLFPNFSNRDSHTSEGKNVSSSPFSWLFIAMCTCKQYCKYFRDLRFEFFSRTIQYIVKYLKMSVKILLNFQLKDWHLRNYHYICFSNYCNLLTRKIHGIQWKLNLFRTSHSGLALLSITISEPN